MAGVVWNCREVIERNLGRALTMYVTAASPKAMKSPILTKPFLSIILVKERNTKVFAENS
jgi:hypothetical protein